MGEPCPAIIPRSPRAEVKIWLAELVHYRQLLFSLIWRDLRVRYKQSVLGYAWALLVPLSMMLVFTLVLGNHVGGSDMGGKHLPYPLYALTGLLPWMFFSSSLNGCVNALVANRNLVTKVYFPREVFPLSCIGGALVDFALGASVLVGLLGWYQWRGQWDATFSVTMLFIPGLLSIQIALTAGIGMWLAMGNLFYRDVRQLTGVLLPLLMFVSGVVIPPPAGDTWTGRLLALNPLIPLLDGYRGCVLNGVWPAQGGVIYAAGFAVITLALGWWSFRRRAHRFAECI